MNSIKKILTLVLLIIFFPIFLEAGWFSKPKNFEECVLEKMKGQDRSMRHYAIKACKKLFPIEEEINYIYQQDIEIAWSGVSSSSIELTIEKNDSNYRISKCKASFSIKKCDDVKDFKDYTLTKTFIFEKGEKKSSIKINNANQYECMRKLSLWGFLKN